MPQAQKKKKVCLDFFSVLLCSSASHAFAVHFLSGTPLPIFYVLNVSVAASLKWLSSRDYCFHLMVAVMAAVSQSY